MTDSFMAVVPGFLGLLSLIFSISGGLWCEFVEIDARVINAATNRTGSILAPKFGVFYARDLVYEQTVVTDSGVTVYYRKQCTRYPSYFTRDAKWDAAMGLQVASWVFAFLLVFGLFWSICIGAKASTYRFIGICFVLIVCFFQGLVFLVMRSNLCYDNVMLQEADDFVRLNTGGSHFFEYSNACAMASGAALVIVAMIGYFFTGMTCCCVAMDGDFVDEKFEAKTTTEEEGAPPPAVASATSG